MMKNKTKEGGSKMKKATKVLSIFVFTSLLLITHNSFAATSRFTPGSDNISPATTTSYNFPQGDGTTQMVAPGNMPGNTIWTSTTTTDGVDRALTQTGNGIQVDGPVPLELQKLLNNPATSRITAEINGQTIQQTASVPGYKPMPLNIDIQAVSDSNFNIERETMINFHAILAIEDQQERMVKYFDFLAQHSIPVQNYFLQHTPFEIETIVEDVE